MTVDEFIAKWEVSGGNERANTQLFVTDLCDLLGVERPTAEILEWPDALPERVVAVAGVVARAARPLAAGEVARAFKGKRAASVSPVLDALAGMGRVRKLADGRYAA